MSNLLTNYLKDGMVIKCTERSQLLLLEQAGVERLSTYQWTPAYVKIFDAKDGPNGVFDFSCASEPKDFLEYGYKRTPSDADFREFIEFEEFYNSCQKDEFTTRDVLNELYLIKQENGDINELFDFFVSNDVDKLLDYLYENKMERLSEKEDLTF